MRSRYFRVALFILIASLFIPSALCYAEGTGYGVKGKNQKVAIFDGGAELLVQEGWEFLDPNAVHEYFYQEDGEDYPIDDNYALLVLLDEDEYAQISISRNYETGHIEGIDNIDIDTDRFLGKYRDYYDGAGFFRKPVYNDEAKSLSWGVILNYDDFDYYLCYAVFFTREGYIEAEITYSGKYLCFDLLDYIEGSITVSPGNRYEDFDPGSDFLCEYDAMSWLLYWNYDGTSRTSTPAEIIGYAMGFANWFIFLIVSAFLIFRFRKLAKSIVRPKKSFEKSKDEGLSYYQKLRREEDREARKCADKDYW